MTIRTILVDDEPLATQGLLLRLEAHEDVEVVATAANGREAIRACSSGYTARPSSISTRSAR
jgi:two-component system LytT family response regulator